MQQSYPAFQNLQDQMIAGLVSSLPHSASWRHGSTPFAWRQIQDQMPFWPSTFHALAYAYQMIQTFLFSKAALAARNADIG